MADKTQCGKCNSETKWSGEILTIVVWAPELKRPYQLIPEDGYKFCLGPKCESPLFFAKRAIEAHAETKHCANTWTKVLIIDTDGEGLFIKHKQPFIARA